MAFDPPRQVRFSEPPATGEDGYFQYALEVVPGGTRLTFEQHGTPGSSLHEELALADGLLSRLATSALDDLARCGWRALGHMGVLMDGGV